MLSGLEIGAFILVLVVIDLVLGGALFIFNFFFALICLPIGIILHSQTLNTTIVPDVHLVGREESPRTYWTIILIELGLSVYFLINHETVFNIRYALTTGF